MSPICTQICHLPGFLFKLYVEFFKILIESYTQSINNCTKIINENFLASDVRISVQKKRAVRIPQSSRMLKQDTQCLYNGWPLNFLEAKCVKLKCPLWTVYIFTCL